MNFDELTFVAWDGEGVNEGFIDEFTERQKLVLLAVSTGETIYREQGISLTERLQFIKRVAQAHPNAIHVFFGASYDFNKILEGLPKSIIEKLHTEKWWTNYIDEDGERWIFRYRPRKELVIGHIREDLKTKSHKQFSSYRKMCDAYIRFWDVIGFFQMPFLKAVEQWLGRDYEDYELILSGKSSRDHFRDSDRQFMIRYNNAELKALVEIMNRLHGDLRQLELPIQRWDGAGAIAAATFKKYRLTDSYFRIDPETSKHKKIELPFDEAIEYAYFGGRIESGLIGRYDGALFNYDINSAYPFAASFLPNLNCGEWVHHDTMTHERVGRMHSLSLCRVQWYFHEQRLYYPFPFRCTGGNVIFPRTGERWLMMPEVQSAIRHMRPGDQIHVLEVWEYLPPPEKVDRLESPFIAIRELYAARQQMLREKDPTEKILKLAINALYGKLCQKLGWSEEFQTSPTFHFLLFAAFITSSTRARIYDVCAVAGDDVISIATDGIISKKPLHGFPDAPIIVSEHKEFGGWSLKTFDAIVNLQSGVYWQWSGGKCTERARGLGRVVGEGDSDEERENDRNQKIEGRVQMVLETWESGGDEIYLPVKQFVTSSKALTGPKWWPRMGHWYKMHKGAIIGRSLQLRCKEWGKRRLDPRANTMHRELVKTVAAENLEWNGRLGDFTEVNRDLGERYQLPWKSGELVMGDNDDDDTE